MELAVPAAAIVALAFVLGTGALLAVRALAVWRSFRAFSRSAGAALDGVMRGVDAAGAHAVAAGRSSERLSAAADRLGESTAHLGLIRAAAAEVGSTVGTARGVVPRK
jgi:hypothetical protein